MTSHSRKNRGRPRSRISSGKSVIGRPAKRQPTAPEVTTSSTIERLERALVLVAYIVVRHGPIYAPYIARLERELETARQNDPTERAKRILEPTPPRGAHTRHSSSSCVRQPIAKAPRPIARRLRTTTLLPPPPDDASPDLYGCGRAEGDALKPISFLCERWTEPVARPMPLVAHERCHHFFWRFDRPSDDPQTYDATNKVSVQVPAAAPVPQAPD